MAAPLTLALGCTACSGAAAPTRTRTVAPASTPGPRQTPGARHPEQAGGAAPANAVPVPAGVPLQAEVERHAGGTAFLLLPGVHRGSVTPKDGDSVYGSAGAVLSGAQQLRGFHQADGRWVVAGVPDEAAPTGECETDHPMCGLPRDLFVDGRLLRRVSSETDVTTGTWYGDAATHTVTVGADPTGHDVEVGVLPQAVTGTAKNVTLSHLTVQMYATPAQQAAVDGRAGRHWVIDSVIAQWNHAGGIVIGPDSLVTDSVADHNGQQGIGGSGTSLRVEGSDISYNGYAGYDPGWSAGGTKFVQTDHLVVRTCTVTHNAGPGLWTDIDNTDVTFEDNAVSDNLQAGIMQEIGYAAVIRNNLVERDGVTVHPWLYGAGILVSSSPDVQVYDNLLRDNGNGIAGIQQQRGTGPGGPHVLHDLDVYDNLVIDSNQTGVAQDYPSTPDVNHSNNRFDQNRYVGGSFAWVQQRTWPGWQASGQDRAGQWSPTE